PPRRPDLLLCAPGQQGLYVVKDPRSGARFTFGEQEHFLLCQLDGGHDAAAISRAFEERFAEPLSEEDFDQFIELVRAHGFLLPAEEPACPAREAGAADVGADTFRVSVGTLGGAGVDTLSATIGVPGPAGSVDHRTTSTAVGTGTDDSVRDEQAAP